MFSGFPGFKVSPPGNIRRKQTPYLNKLYNRSLQETDYQGSSQSMSRYLDILSLQTARCELSHAKINQYFANNYF